MLFKLKEMLTDRFNRPILQYYDEEQEEFRVQPQIATERSVKSELVLLNQTTSASGVEIPPNSEWVSRFYETRGLTHLTYFSSVSNDPNFQGRYELIVEPSLNGISDRPEFGFSLTPEGLVRNASGTEVIRAPYIRLKIKNLSDNPIRIGVFLYLTRT